MTDSRASLYTRLVEVLGDVHADTLMSHLLTTPGEQIATKADIESLGDRILLRLDKFEERMDRLEERMDRLMERMDRLEERMDRLEERMDRLEERMDRLEQSTDRSEDRMDRFDTRFDGLRQDIQGLTAYFGSEMRAQTRQFILASLGSSALIAGGIVGAAVVL